MRILQLTPTLVMGDGVSNDTLTIHYFLEQKGIETKVYCENIDSRISHKVAEHISKMPELSEEDIILFHLSTGTEMNEMIKSLPARKIFINHNITPSEWFDGYNATSGELCRKGIEQTKSLSKIADYCLADSEFNKADLESYGYTCPIDVLPIMIPFEDYDQTPDEKVIKQYQDGYTNILFTGRIAPNKKQEDLILAFYHYQKYYNPKSRLILVGSYNGMEKYYAKLQEYVRKLGVENVIFTGHISFKQILAFYRVADLFLCMSEHEGFCIPLLEAMHFGIPIIAYDSTAIPYTLGNAGIIFEQKNYLEVAGLIDYVVRHDELKEQLIEKEKERLKVFSYDSVVNSLWEKLTRFTPELKGL